MYDGIQGGLRLLDFRLFSFLLEIKPKVSVLIPVFNQASIISRILNSLLKNLALPAEVIIIIIIDKCNDNSSEVVIDYFSNILKFNELESFQNMIMVKVIISSNLLFKTKADNLGFENAQGEYIIELQSDMSIDEFRFDAKLVVCLEQNQDLFAISGRGVTTLLTVRNSEFKRRTNPISYALHCLFNLVRKGPKIIAPVQYSQHPIEFSQRKILLCQAG